MPKSQDFARRLRRIRETQGMTQEQFAEALGVRSHQISDIERGKTDPSVWILGSIASIFHIDPEWLLLGPAGHEDTEPRAPERPSTSDLQVIRDLRRHFGGEAEPHVTVAWKAPGEGSLKEEDWLFIPLVASLEDIGAHPLMDKQVRGYCPVLASIAAPGKGLRCACVTDDDMAPLVPKGSIVGIEWMLRNPSSAEGRIVCARTESGDLVIRRFHAESRYWVLTKPAAEGMTAPPPMVVSKSAVPNPIIGTVVFAWVDFRK